MAKVSRIKSLKQKLTDTNGDISDYGDKIPLGADAEFIDMEAGHNLEEEVVIIKNYLDKQIENALNGRY